jgi:hypothetical protein
MTWGFRPPSGHGQSSSDREGADRAPPAKTRRVLSVWPHRRDSGNIPPPQLGEETMGKINLGRVLVGGIVAGVIVDVFEYFLNAKILADQWHALMAAQKLPMWGMNEIIAFDVMGLAIGLIAVWTYAAIRPRFGAGPKTAVYAALLIWVLAYVLSSLSPLIMGMFSQTLFLTMIGVGLVEIVVATVAGAFIYKEAEAT